MMKLVQEEARPNKYVTEWQYTHVSTKKKAPVRKGMIIRREKLR